MVEIFEGLLEKHRSSVTFSGGMDTYRICFTNRINENFQVEQNTVLKIFN
jgi:hypothetical protein